MTTIAITKDDQGKLVGVGEKGRKTYAAFKRRVESLVPGEVYTIEAWFDRNPKLHGLHFALLTIRLLLLIVLNLIFNLIAVHLGGLGLDLT